MSNNTIIVDGNSMGHTAHHYQKKILPAIGKDFESQAIGGFLEVITSIYESNRKEYPNLIVLWDGKSKYRNDLYPEYKGTRRITPEQIDSDLKYKAQVPYIESFLNHLGIRQYKASDFEADDVAGYFIRRAVSDGRKILLESNDHDWLQYVNENTSCHSPKGGNQLVYGKDNFHEYINLTQKQFIEYKAILGDKSDNIIKIPDIGEKTALALLQEFGSVDKFMKAYNSNESNEIIQNNVVLKRYRKALHNFYEDKELHSRFDLNMKLVDLLRPDFDNEMSKNIKYTNPKVNKQEFVNLCSHLNLSYYAKFPDRWDIFFDKNNTPSNQQSRGNKSTPRP